MNKLTNWIKSKTDKVAEKDDSLINQNLFKKQSKDNPKKRKFSKNFKKKNQNNQNKHSKHNKHRNHSQHPRKNSPHKQAHKQTHKQRFKSNKLLKIIPIAGLDEVGKNMNAIEYDNQIVIIDCGLQFPEPGMFGIDYVIPDTNYLEKNKRKIKAILITHGHLDHIGGLKHILPKLGFPPVYGSGLTIGMISKQLEEYKLNKHANLTVVKSGETFPIGHFKIEYFAQNHSIPDSMGIVVRTPVGNIVHTGDYKFDFSPATGECANFQHLARIGQEGVLALMGESTNATLPGYSTSEKKVAAALEDIIEKAKGRLIISSFSSLMGRINQILQIAHKNDKQVFISGRSMINNVEIGVKLGFIHPPKGTLKEIRQLRNHPKHKTIILCTGTQGEGLSALNRVANGEHRDIKLTPGDTIVLSSNAIIGNEILVVNMVNKLLRQGAQVITNKHMDVHTTGHAKQEEIKLMIKLIQPKYLVPVHGEYILRDAHRRLALEIGTEENQIIMAENGDIIETDGETMRKSKSKVPANNIFIDGSSEGEEHLSKVQIDRQIMSENGIVLIVFRVNQDTNKLIANPGIDSRGFIYLQDSPEIYSKCIDVAKKAYEKAHAAKQASDITKLDIKRGVGKVIMNEIKRNPLIMPIFVKV